MYRALEHHLKSFEFQVSNQNIFLCTSKNIYLFIFSQIFNTITIFVGFHHENYTKRIFQFFLEP